MKERVDIEQLVRSQFTGAEFPPSNRVWAGIRRQMRWQQFLRFRPWHLNIYTIGGAMLIGLGSLLLMDRQDEGHTEATDPISGTINEIKAGELPDSDIPALPSGENRRVTGMEGVASSVQSDTSGIADKKEEDERQAESKAEGAGYSPVRDKIQNGVEPGSEAPILPPEAHFVPSVTAGCAPLKVSFFNHSENALAFRWIFDDLGVSTDPDPIFSFREPGTYTVTLIAVNQEGWSRRTRQIIRVHGSPEAGFEISDPMVNHRGEREATLMNYTADAVFYQWSLIGTTRQWSSIEYQPSLSSGDAGEEGGSIRLVATNEAGCSDTAVRKIPEGLLPVSSTLQFPTAFSPNPTGPLGGSYSPQEKRTDIFHPVFVEAPAEYHLRIYTRRGELVFQTDNIYIGWDGYYLQERSASDVYVWMAGGTWSDGREFMLRGDVTLLWNGYH